MLVTKRFMIGLILLMILLGGLAFTIHQRPYQFNGLVSTANIYAYTQADMLADSVRSALPRVYVPNGLDNTVSVIDPNTYTVIGSFKTGKSPEHVVPAYDLKTLFVLNDKGNSVTPINPFTAQPSADIPVNDPYNLYFTPDGHYAIVVCERDKRLDFRDPHTMALKEVVPLHCRGANHMEFTADGRYALVTCEFSGQLFKFDVNTHQVLGYLSLTTDNAHGHSMPQDIRSSPDGRYFFVADMMANGVHIIDPVALTKVGFIPTGLGAHGIYPSRDGRVLYISNRGCDKMHCGPHGHGSISVLDPFQLKVIAQWPMPGGGSPDMGNVNAHGNELWLSGRFDNEVYVFDTQTGALRHRIPVGRGPHGLAVWPQPGRYSLGHTGNMR